MWRHRAAGLTGRVLSRPAFLDIQDWRGDDTAMLGVFEFQAHAPADIAHFEHRPAPRGAQDMHQHGLRAEGGVTGNERLAFSFVHKGITVILSPNLENRFRCGLIKVNATLDFRLHHIVVDQVAKVGTRVKHRSTLPGLIHAPDEPKSAAAETVPLGCPGPLEEKYR